MDNTSGKKKGLKVFLTILKIVFFPIYLPLKFLWSIVMLLVELMDFFVHHKILTTVLLLILFLFYYGMYKGYDLGKNYNSVYLTNREFYGDSNSVKLLDDKIKTINGKIKTLSDIENTNVKITAGDVVLYNNDFKSSKKWKIDFDSLIVGENIVTITVNFENGKNKTETFYVLNTTDDNIGSLDNSDDDKDGIVNYLEDVYKTNKNRSDSDNDGLDDIVEILVTATDALNAYSCSDTINDGQYDSDGDGLSNVVEINNDISPVNVDSDGDGLNDYEEYIVYKSNPNLIDTDGDGASDYDEVINYKTNPNEKNSKFSGNFSNGIVSYTINDVNDLSKIDILDVNYNLINENTDGFITKPYKLYGNSSSLVSFNYDTKKVDDNSIPTIYKIDEKTNDMIEVNTVANNGVATANIDGSDGIYVLYDKNYFDEVIDELISVGNDNVDIAIPENNEYFMIDVLIIRLLLNKLEELFNTIGINYKAPEYNKSVIYCSGKCSEEALNRDASVLNNEVEEDIFRFEKMHILFPRFMRILQREFIRFCDSLFDDEYIRYEQYDDIHYSKVYMNIIYVFDISGVDNLEILMFGDDQDRLLGSDYLSLNLKDDKDSNNDGISDNLTELIVAGKITTKTGINPFKNIGYDSLNKNADYDKDGLKNGEEIIVRYDNGYYYLDMISDPTLVDSDSDCISDKKDASPLISNNDVFVCRKSIKGDPTNLKNLENRVYRYNYSFGTGDYVFGENGAAISIKYLAYPGEEKYSKVSAKEWAYYGGQTAAGYAAFFIKDASSGLRRYFEATGETYTEKDATDFLFRSNDVQTHINNNISKLVNYSYASISNGSTVTVESKEMLVGCSAGSNGSIKTIGADFNAVMFLHSAGANTIAEITNNNGTYTMKLRYFIEDVYDWDDGVDEHEFFNVMLLGGAKGYLVHIEYDYTVTFSKGVSPKIVYHETTVYK